MWKILKVYQISLIYISRIREGNTPIPRFMQKTIHMYIAGYTICT